MVKLGTGTVFRPTVSEETDILVALALETGVFKPIEIEALRKLLSDYFGPNPEEGHRAVTYELNGKPIGFAYFGPTEMTDRTWHLFWIFVDRATHARGIGAKIMDYVESEVRDSGGRAIIVETSGLPNYDLTRRFYLKLGYKQVAVVPDFYADDDDMVVFWKHLGK